MPVGDFADMKFKAECGLIELTNVGDPTFAIRGPGEIWQNEVGVLEFKIFSSRETYIRLRNYAARPGVIGEPIPGEEFFNLRAVSYNMPVWTAERIMPFTRGGLLDGLACGYIHELVETREAPHGDMDQVIARFKGKLEFPSNQSTQTETLIAGHVRGSRIAHNVAVVETNGLTFEITHDNTHTVVSLLMPAGQYFATTPSRIRESLQFVLGQELVMLMTESIASNQLVTRYISPISNRGTGRIYPPLEPEQTQSSSDFWRMFSNYFEFIRTDTASPMHPISRHVNSAIESAAASLEAEILGLSVAVEGVIGECFQSLAPVSEQFRRELKIVETSLANIQISEQTRNRIIGATTAMREARNSDLLRAFITSQQLNAGLYRAWSTLRNTSAHGSGITEQDSETLARLKNETLSLFYSVILSAINYSGPRTDYSVPGHPCARWPIVSPQI